MTDTLELLEDADTADVDVEDTFEDEVENASWTAQDSLDFDRFAREVAYSESPVPFDQKLWDALAQDRLEAPWKPNTSGEHGRRVLLAYHANRPPIPTHCSECGSRMRKSKQTAREFPGTVRHYAGTLCQVCAERLRRAGKLVTRRPTKKPKVWPCVGCGALLRPNRATKEECPGTLKHAGRDMCVTCWRKDRAQELAEAEAQAKAGEEA